MSRRMRGIGVGRRRSGRARGAAGPAALAALLALAGAAATPAAAGDPAARPAAEAVAAIRSGAPRPATLRLVIEHRSDEGRLILKLGDQAILSAPLAALAGNGDRPHERDLSIPAGRHDVTVLLLDGRGRVVAREILNTTVEAADPAILVIAGHRGSGDGLTLSWRTP